MTQFVHTDENGRINATTPYIEYAGSDMFAFTFPDDFDFSTQNEYRIVEGELVHDPLPEPVDLQISELKQKLYDTDYAVIKVYESMVTGEALPDEDAERYAEIIEQRKAWRVQINELEASSEGGD